VSGMVRFLYRACALMILSILVLVNGPSIESWLYPVTSSVNIYKTQPSGSNSTKIWLTFKKNRTCTFVDIGFYEVDKRHGGLRRVSFKFLEDDGAAPVSRPEGTQSAGPWLVGVSGDRPLENLIATTRHKCHPLWDTITKFYP